MQGLFRYFFILSFVCLGICGESHAIPISDPPLQIVTADFPPCSYQLDGRPSGVMTDIMREVLKELARDGRSPSLANVKIEYFPWKRAFKMATEGKNVLLYPVGISPEREKLLKWVGPQMSRNIWIYALKSNRKPNSMKKEDFKEQLVGITRGYSWEKDVVDLGAIPDEAVDDRTLIRKIIGNRMSYIAMDELVLNYTLKLMSKDDPEIRKYQFQKVFPLNTNGSRTFGFAINSNPELMARFEAAYRKVERRNLIQRVVERSKYNN
ncbi:MAG TPA: transporter substrate-binding domain-containing protein [Bdellovibrio sp.]|uniref:substrate-binding periplasmic protein n=1 Tax=Bdellovibrio sp. TaxID=28201 RepID=UPI002EDED060